MLSMGLRYTLAVNHGFARVLQAEQRGVGEHQAVRGSVVEVAVQQHVGERVRQGLRQDAHVRRGPGQGRVQVPTNVVGRVL